jgi:predicted HicB family RNase H-like nuclease
MAAANGLSFQGGRRSTLQTVGVLTAMEERIDLKTRKPAGAVLSVRVPQEVASAIDSYAASHGLSLSETVRIALELLVQGATSSADSQGYSVASGAPLTISYDRVTYQQRTLGSAEPRASYEVTRPAR